MGAGCVPLAAQLRHVETSKGRPETDVSDRILLEISSGDGGMRVAYSAGDVFALLW